MKGMYRPKKTNVVKLKKVSNKKDKRWQTKYIQLVGGVVQFRNGWGGIYYDLSVTSAVPSLLSTLQARASYYENVTCTTATLTTIENIE